MKRIRRLILMLVIAALILCGCSMTTVDGMYKIPKRSDNFNSLQTAIDDAMIGLAYCAPLAGENRQTVHMADLDGDNEDEFLLFAKGSEEKPLRIMVFRKIDDSYVNTDTVACNGTAFDQVEYVDMNGDGLEMIVGCQLSDQVIRTASVYSFVGGKLQERVSVNYTKFLTTDLNGDGFSELFLLKPGLTETDAGVAELYGMHQGEIKRYNAVTMSRPVDRLKRIIQGKLDGGKTAVYIASAADENSLITDVCTLIEQSLVNITLSGDAGTSIHTMRSFYVYADDIDADGVVELPALLPMRPVQVSANTDTHQLIRWYAMTANGDMVDKLYTYHNFADGWYLQLDSAFAAYVTALNTENTTEFYLWDKNYETCQKIMTVYAFTGEAMEELDLRDDRFILEKTDKTVFCGKTEPVAEEYGITNESVVYSFRLIQQDWKTGLT